MWLMHSKPMLVFCCLPRPPRGPAAAARLVPSSMGLGHRWMQKKAVLRGGRKEHDPGGCCLVVAGEGAGVSPRPTAPQVLAMGLVVHIASRSALRPRLVCRPSLLGQRHQHSLPALWRSDQGECRKLERGCWQCPGEKKQPTPAASRTGNCPLYQ